MKDENLPPHAIRFIFTHNMRNIRRLKEISQEALAFEAGVSRAYISDIERGKRSLSIDVMGRIADALDVPVITLFKTDDLLDEFLKVEQQ